jgi:hypothetical protein
MSLKATATVLRMMAVVVCAAGTCLSDSGVSSGLGGPDCCSTMPGDVDGSPPVNLRDFTITHCVIKDNTWSGVNLGVYSGTAEASKSDGGGWEQLTSN